ncbi:multidrug transporter [Lasius niger]|uniref:Multidrug transporter n=1 Tax=Lasius niger TaxID=67767 RepID=A0A0J7KBL7_LASNI|nr:multidrug transporter [Lasius niger]
MLGSPIERSYKGDLSTLSPLSQSLPSRFSPSVLRGDDLEQTRINLSRLGTTLGPPSIRREIKSAASQDLFDRIEQVQERIDHINCEIATKNASLQMMDAVAGSVLEDLAFNVSLEADQRVGRARRRGEASRPRGGPPRTRSPNTYDKMAMEQENNEITLPPQGIRTPSGRRESPTVPGALPSPSSVGPLVADGRGA